MGGKRGRAEERGADKSPASGCEERRAFAASGRNKGVVREADEGLASGNGGKRGFVALARTDGVGC